MRGPIVRVETVEYGNDDVWDTHAEASPDCQGPSANFVNDEETYHHRNQLPDVECTGQNQRETALSESGEKFRGVVDECVDSTELQTLSVFLDRL